MEKIETEIIEEGFKLKKPTSSSLSFGVPCKGTSVAHWGEVFLSRAFVILFGFIGVALLYF